MQEVLEQLLTIVPPDYKEAINNRKQFLLQFPYYSPEVEVEFLKIMHRFLGQHDLLYVKEVLLSVIKELITNAVKANTKRVYFKRMNLDINNDEDYKNGMESFKTEVFGNKSELFELLKEELIDYYVRIAFQASRNKIAISVINNTPITNDELQKINNRIEKAYYYNDIGDAFDDVLDDSEGAGLGLTIAIMLFKNSGFPQNALGIESNGDKTKAIINIPFKTHRITLNKKITAEIMKEVEEIPSFPENILEIQRLCSDPNSTIKQISSKIKLDPGLTTAILKLSNSAGFITLNKTKTIEDAIKLIGLKTIEMLLLTTEAQKILESRFKKCSDIWRNSYKAAFYAQKIAKKKKQIKLSDFVYIATLLADIGKIVLLSIKPDVNEKITKIAGRKDNINSDLLEEISLGIDHGTLGGLICKHWKFDKDLTKVIELHQRPHLCTEEHKNLIYLINIAYQFSEIEDNRARFELIDEDILDFFKLKNKNRFEKFHDSLKKAYLNHHPSE